MFHQQFMKVLFHTFAFLINLKVLKLLFIKDKQKLFVFSGGKLSSSIFNLTKMAITVERTFQKTSLSQQGIFQLLWGSLHIKNMCMFSKFAKLDSSDSHLKVNEWWLGLFLERYLSYPYEKVDNWKKKRKGPR